MTPEKMRGVLEQLHSELQRAPTVDPQSRRLLEEVSADIHKVLDEDAARARDRHGVHAPRLDELAVEFEAEHPSLAAVVRQVADALSRIGL